MKLVYVAGPYRSKWGIVGRAINIIKARKVAKELWQAGYAVICPHSNTAFFDGIVTDEMVLKGDIEILKRCDFIAMMPGYKKSKGAVTEYDFAVGNNIPVIM